MEPYEEYDVYTGKRDEYYKRITEGKTCLDCGNCTLPYGLAKQYDGIGYCKVIDEFVDDRYTIDEIGADCFEV